MTNNQHSEPDDLDIWGKPMEIKFINETVREQPMEYFCSDCGQLRLTFANNITCGNCGSDNLTWSVPEYLNKKKLKGNTKGDD